MLEQRTTTGISHVISSPQATDNRRSPCDRRRTDDRRRDPHPEDGTSVHNEEMEALLAALEIKVAAAIRQNEWRIKNDSSGWDKLVISLPAGFPQQPRAKNTAAADNNRTPRAAA